MQRGADWGLYRCTHEGKAIHYIDELNVGPNDAIAIKALGQDILFIRKAMLEGGEVLTKDNEPETLVYKINQDNLQIIRQN